VQPLHGTLTNCFKEFMVCHGRHSRRETALGDNPGERRQQLSQVAHLMFDRP
jgi:hypothetical protein